MSGVYKFPVPSVRGRYTKLDPELVSDIIDTEGFRPYRAA
jgi:hypothetical protein